jgi:small subunit ribosomal protein S16
MSVTIRLARVGKRHAPAYKIVAANTRDKRNGKFLDILGHYNPSHNPVLFEIDKKKYEEWKNKGALSTDAVEKLIAGTYEYVKYEPNKEEEAEEETPTEEAKENSAATEETKEKEEEK